mgnify:CR=1 FL=1
MNAIEKEANAAGLGYDRMMQNAGFSLAEIVMGRYGDSPNKQVLGMIGPGNNGGDTLIALAIMQRAGWNAIALLAMEHGKNDPLIETVAEQGGEIIHFNGIAQKEILAPVFRASGVILDGLLGTGFKLPLRGAINEILILAASYGRNAHIVAVDCPSGTDCDSGQCAPETLNAEITVCMAAVKQGLLHLPAVGRAGEIIRADIGLPMDALADVKDGTLALDCELAGAMIPTRPADAHKGTFGKCMIVGGSVPYPGAAMLSAQAAYRAGAGLVCTAVPAAIYDGLIGSMPESIWLTLPHTLGQLNSAAADVVLANLEKTHTLLVGPGMGWDKPAQDFFHSLLDFSPKSRQGQLTGFIKNEQFEIKETIVQPGFVIDADALRILPFVKNWHKKLEKMAVLTPHPGEMAVLTGLEVDEIQKNRMEIACQFAAKYGHVVVLKGAVTVIASPDGKRAVVPIATPALATAGSGDVLAGIIAGLLAQGADAFESAAAGAWVHAVSGLAAARDHGQTATIMARDIIAHMPGVLKNITAR